MCGAGSPYAAFRRAIEARNLTRALTEARDLPNVSRADAAELVVLAADRKRTRSPSPKLDSPLLFPAAGGGYIDLEKFRRDHWAPAIRASGIEHHRIYDLRRSFASSAIAAGVSLFLPRRIMGTSVAQIDATTGTFCPTARTTCAASSTPTTNAATRKRRHFSR